MTKKNKEAAAEGKKGARWSRPRLVVLGRGRPEESILLACKIPNDPGCRSGPGRPSLNPGRS